MSNKHHIEKRGIPGPLDSRPLVFLFHGSWTRLEWLHPPHPLAGPWGVNYMSAVA